MKNSIVKSFVLSFVLLLSFVSFAQDKVESAEVDANTKPSSYDPLVAQKFAVDSESQTMVVINENENTVEILSRTKDGFEKTKQLLVDNAEGRHDVFKIYVPQSVAVYEHHIVYLASNRDSSFVKVLTLDGVEKEFFKFRGAAQAFSYDVSTKLLYIAGSNAAGYNVFVVDATKGFDNMTIKGSPSYQYIKKKKADEMAEKDPSGAGLAIIAMGTVFLVLILITVILSVLFGKLMVNIQNKKGRKQPDAAMSDTEKTTGKKTSDISGEEFAAIAAAIHLYNDEMHDEESTILTINKVAKAYSPWSSKLYNMNPYRR